MTIDRDLECIARQEAELCFDRFNLDMAFELGSMLHKMAASRKLPVVIDITLHAMPAFYAALPGSTRDNANWVRRKQNLVLRFLKSSYAIGLQLARQGVTVEQKYGLPGADYAPHGGSFPIHVKGTGCIGAVTVSGLPQRDDHNLVVEALAIFLKQDPIALRLPEA
nr:heme-degrading domain-containing protein [uncultured Gellertiella sp.]